MNNLDPTPNQNNDKLSPKRRALIKGSALAIPAILTLRSGSALAATSISCALKTQDNPPTSKPSAVSTTDDNWLRSPTQCRTLTPSNPPATPFDVYQDPTNPTYWYNVAVSNADTSVAFVDGASGIMTNAGLNYTYSGSSTCYVLIQVDANGTQTNVVGASTSGFPFASDSCYQSLHP